VGLLSAAALDLTMGAPGLAMGATSRRHQQRISPDYVDVTKLRLGRNKCFYLFIK